MSLYQINDGKLSAVRKTTFSEERILERQHLQEMLKQNINILAPNTMVLTEEFGEWEDSRRRIDLLCLDNDARLVVVELKRTEDGGHMELQALRYAAMVSKMTFSAAVKAHQKFKGISEEEASEAILNFLGWAEPLEEEFAQDISIILASAEFSKELITTVMWLSERDINIQCMKLKPYRLNEQVLIDLQQIFPLPEAEDYQIKIREKEREERKTRTQNRDTTRYNLSIDGNLYENIPKRKLVLKTVLTAFQKGNAPLDIIENEGQWVILEGTLNSEEFIVQSQNIQKRAGGSTRDTDSFYTNKDALMHHDGKTYALSKMWSRAIPTVTRIKQKFALHNLSFDPVDESDT